MQHTLNIKRAFVCGWPIEHSRSPLIHSYWLKKYQLEGNYEKIAVSPQDLPKFLETMRDKGFIGGNFTIPHKEQLGIFLSSIDAAATTIGAINTVWFENDEWQGSNTDWIGFAANMDQWAPDWDNSDQRKKTAVVLGAGGAARGILYALQQRGFSNIILVNRTLQNAVKIADEFPGNIIPKSLNELDELPTDISVLVNTTSLGMSGKNELPQSLVEYISKIDKTTVVSDIVYIPLKTEFLNHATACNLKTVDGLGMLLHQAAPGFEHWFAVKPQVTQELRDLILDDIGRSS